MFSEVCEYPTKAGNQCTRPKTWHVWSFDPVAMEGGTVGPVWMAVCGHHLADVSRVVSMIDKRKGK